MRPAALTQSKYLIDLADPRAPSAKVWAELAPDERAQVVEALPSEFGPSEQFMPEGPAHFHAKVRAEAVLRTFFQRTGRSFFIACEMPIYYPGEPMFAPDVMMVLDIPERPRENWVVSAEGRGIDFALEVLYSGRRRKDLVRNVAWFARLGIPEYFVFDAQKSILRGYRLAPGDTRYQTLLPQQNRFSSAALGLELGILDGNLRFFRDQALLPEPAELIAQLSSAVDEQIQRRFEAEEKQLEAEEKLLETEQKLAEALAELERLRVRSK